MLSRFLLLIVFLPYVSHTQTGNFSFRNININQGLSQNSVVSIAEDQAGFMWFATQDGLNKYDGKQFEIFHKNFDDITTLTHARLGKLLFNGPHDLWLIKNGGQIEKMNLLTRRFTNVKTIGRDSVVLPPASSLYIDKQQNTWIGTEDKGVFIHLKSGKVLRLHAGATPQLRLPDDKVQSILQEANGVIWVLTAQGICSYSIKGSEYPQLTFTSTSETLYSCLEIDQHGNKWLGSFGNSLFYIKKGEQELSKFEGFGELEQLPDSLTIQSIKSDRIGRLWLGTYGDGLYLVDYRNSSVRHFSFNMKDPRSLGYNDVLSIFEDSKGGIWVGTDGGGVSFYDRSLNNFTLISRYILPDTVSVEQVRSIATDPQGSIWIGTSNTGLVYANPQSSTYRTYNFTPFARRISNYQRIVSLYADNSGSLWVGSQGNGLLLMNRTSNKNEKRFHPEAKGKLRIPDHTIWCIIPESDQQIWIGTRSSGLCLVDKHKGLLASYSFTKDQPIATASDNVRAIQRISDSVLCLGFETGEVLFFNTKSQRAQSPGTELRKIQTSGTVLKSVNFTDSILWIGTLGKGLYAYNLRNNELFNLREQQGLPNNTIYAILTDEQNALWMSSNNGIIRFFPPKNLRSTAAANFTHYTVMDGLQSNEFNTGAFHQSANGHLYFGGSNGLNIFNPAELSLSAPSTRVVVTKTTVNNEDYEGDTSVPYKTFFDLPYESNSLSFEFVAADFVSPQRYKYYYQLKGYDESWIEAGKRNYAAYTSIPAGSYVFQVKAASGDISSNEPVTSIDILIRKPFWQQWWFISLCVLTVVGILYLLYRYRIRQLMHLQNIRNRIATDLHDDIGSTLTNISLLSELSRRNSTASNSLFLDRIAEEVNHSSQALDDIVWSINTRNDSLDQTVARMRRYAAEVFDAANVSYTLQFDEQFGERKLNMEQRRDCFLIFKEAINNIYKHAEARNVHIRVWIERNLLKMTIEDDGRGFDPEAYTNRNGIRNMKQRTNKWKGDLRLESERGKGTRLQVDFGSVN